MSNVTLTIAGRKYKVACDAGEEAHIERLGQIIDERLGEQDGISGQSEVRSLLYAALILADEVHERQRPPALDPEPFERMADRLEAIAQQLENIGPSA